jgi:hypothetical protein
LAQVFKAMAYPPSAGEAVKKVLFGTALIFLIAGWIHPGVVIAACFLWWAFSKN